jgi:putative PEP-CTERM system histidine kinase
VSRDAAFHTATLILVGIYLLLISASSYYVRQLGGDWGGALQIILVCASLVVLATLVFSGTVRAKLQVFVSKHFFRYRYDYRNEWLRFTARLSAGRSPREVGSLVVQGLAQMLHSPAGALWYRDAGRALLVQAARWNSPANDSCEPDDSPFARFVREQEWVVDLDAWRRGPRGPSEGAAPPAWALANSQYWLMVPLIVGSQLVGIVVIERPHAMTALNWEVRDLLKTASRQAASFLALIHATEALLEARKFEAFNKMSAFVVHDLKNIFTQLSLMVQNARRLKDNPEFQEDMLATVANSLEKMRRLMLQLRSGEMQSGPVAGVALPVVVDRVRAAAAARGRSLGVEIADRVVARGEEQRIERVIGHLVDNAFDATESEGAVTLSLSREGGQARLVVCDTGHGMNPEFVASGLFKPFSSTKVHGMGIGVYESRQYIHELGGSMTVESEVGRGTTVTVRLPLLETGHGSMRELHGVQ